MIPIAEEKPKVDPEAPERDRDLSSLPTSALGIRRVEGKRHSSLQGPRSQSELAFEAGYDDGYGDGYIDGYDDGQFNQLVGLIRLFEAWIYEEPYLVPEGNWNTGVYDVINELKSRLEHDGKSDDRA